MARIAREETRDPVSLPGAEPAPPLCDQEWPRNFAITSTGRILGEFDLGAPSITWTTNGIVLFGEYSIS
jgi:hypothetical protein